MNRIAKVLSFFLSAILVFSVAVVMIVQSSAADVPTFSLNIVKETDDEVVVAVRLDNGSFNAVDFVVKPASKNISRCIYATESDDFFAFLKDIKKLGGVGSSAGFAETGKFCVAVTIAYDRVGKNIVEYAFSKNTADRVTNTDIILNVTSCQMNGNNVTAKVVNNLSASVIPTTTERTTERTTEPENLATEPSTVTETPSVTENGGMIVLPNGETIVDTTDETITDISETVTETNKENSFIFVTEDGTTLKKNQNNKENDSEKEESKEKEGLSAKLKNLIIVILIISALLAIAFIILAKKFYDAKAQVRINSQFAQQENGWEDHQ